jgi:hypothetical protein
LRVEADEGRAARLVARLGLSQVEWTATWFSKTRVTGGQALRGERPSNSTELTGRGRVWCCGKTLLEASREA